jgi:GT2 family glycosyltransferase
MRAWEAIVVDDGSTKGNVEAVVAGIGDPRIRVIRQENRGMGGARNTGFEAAGAELVLTLDADDRLDPSFLDVAVTALESDAEADCVFMDSQCFGRSREIRYFPQPLPPPCPQHPAYPDCGVLMRKRMWKDAGGYSQDRTLAGVEWWDFWLTAIERGMQVRHLAKPLYLYRTHLEGASVTSSMYDEYRNREQLYTRHQRIFDTFSTACSRGEHSIRAFRAQGYVTSSRASLMRRERGRALQMAARGFLVYPWHWLTVKQIGKALISGSLPLRAWRRLRRRSG